MVGFRKFKFGWIVALLATTGCAEYHKRTLLYNTYEGGDAFTKALSQEYEALGKIEQEIMYDEGSADYYYRKAILAKEGFYVGPTTLEKWNIEQDKIEELAVARVHLRQLFCMGARMRAPEMTAKAQAHFDCWVEQQSEGWQVNDIAWCRSEFHKAISEIELILKGGMEVITPLATILFEYNSAELTQESMIVIEDTAQKQKASVPQGRILLIGRTDKIGDPKYNTELSLQRAIMVKKALVHAGVPAHLISIKAEGETPGPNVEAHNRRVDIIFLEGKK